MTFTGEQIGTLVAALPGVADTHRRENLPCILKEWSQIDLEDHFSRSTPKQIRAKRKKIDRIAKEARNLAQALSEVQRHVGIAIAGQLLVTDAGSQFNLLNHEDSSRSKRRLDEELERLELLAKRAIEASTAFVPPPLRKSTLIRYLILLDLAAIFEWATQQSAGRRVKTDISDDAGKNYGPFWDFVSAIWPMIFGSVAGLDYALKNWAESRGLYKDASPIIRNIDMRHPEWRIRETGYSDSAISRG